MVQVSAVALTFSFLPFVFRAAGFDDPEVMSASSFLFAVGGLLVAVDVLLRQHRRLGTVLLPETRVFDIVNIAITTVLVAALFARSAGYLPGLGFAPYIAGLLYALAISIAMFVRIVLFTANDDSDQ
jgi:hypothetical protein